MIIGRLVVKLEKVNINMNLTREQQIVELMKEGYTYQQASDRLEYIPVVENKQGEECNVKQGESI